MRRLALVATALAALVAALAGTFAATPLPSAAAQSRDTPTGTLTLASQTAWVGPGQELDMRVVASASAPLDDVELAVGVYRSVGSRSEFQNTVKDRLRGTPLTTTATPLSELERDAAGAYTIRLPIQDPDLPIDRTRLRLRDEGVYPVRVELRETGGGRSIARLVTHLVYASPPTDTGLPLGFSWIIPLSAPPAIQPDGSRRLPERAAARIGAITEALGAHPTVSLSLHPNPETVQALDPEVRAALAEAAINRQVLASTYVQVHPGAFAATGGEAEFSAQLDHGVGVLADTLGVRADTRTWVGDERIDDAALDRLRTQQIDRIVLPEPAFAPANLPVTLAHPFELQSRSLRRPTAAATDLGLEAHFTPLDDEPDDPVLRAHTLLADLAVIYFDRPGRPRAVLAQTPPDWSPQRTFLDAVLAGLASGPIVKGTTVDQVFDVPLATTGRTTLTRRLAETPPPPTLPLTDIRTTRARLEAFASMLAPENPIDDQLEEVLLASESSHLRGRQRVRYLTGVDRRIANELRQLDIPRSRTITLTARRGEIPLTIRWTGDYPIQLRVRLASDRLVLPNHDPVRSLMLSRRNITERFVVQARSSGDFPLRITLESPEGSLVLAQSRVTVRSTAASGVGLGLSIGAGLILVVWWARHLARGRRNKRLVPA